MEYKKVFTPACVASKTSSFVDFLCKLERSNAISVENQPPKFSSFNEVLSKKTTTLKLSLLDNPSPQKI